MPGPRSSFDDARLRELYGTRPAREVAAQMGVSIHAVHNRAKKLGLKGWRGAFSRKFDRAEAVRLFRSGLSLEQVAARLGVAIASVWRACPEVHGKGDARTRWLPRHRREDYARFSRHVGAAEARRIILAELQRGAQ